MRSDDNDAALRLSPLGHTWLIDFDGCVVVHNGYRHGADQLLPGVAEFWQSLPTGDAVIILSARGEELRALTETTLQTAGLRYDRLILGLPHGERIVVNDRKPSGLKTAFAVNLPRDTGLGQLQVNIDETL